MHTHTHNVLKIVLRFYIYLFIYLHIYRRQKLKEYNLNKKRIAEKNINNEIMQINTN